ARWRRPWAGWSTTRRKAPSATGCSPWSATSCRTGGLVRGPGSTAPATPGRIGCWGRGRGRGGARRRGGGGGGGGGFAWGAGRARGGGDLGGGLADRRGRPARQGGRRRAGTERRGGVPRSQLGAGQAQGGGPVRPGDMTAAWGKEHDRTVRVPGG